MVLTLASRGKEHEDPAARLTVNRAAAKMLIVVMKRRGEVSKEERSQLTQEQLDELLQQAGAGPAFLPGGSMPVTLADLKACEGYFEKLPNGQEPSSKQYEGVLMDAVLYDAL